MSLRWMMVAVISLIGMPFLGMSQEMFVLSPGTTIPVVLLHTVDASKAHPGDTIQTSTLSSVFTASGAIVPKGTMVLAHVVEVASATSKYSDEEGFTKEEARLAIQFDAFVLKGKHIPLVAAVRAIADPNASFAAHVPDDPDLDPEGNTTQIGGDRLSGIAPEVRSRFGDVVGHRRSGGIYDRLLPNVRGMFTCSGSISEQAVGPFSADACGVYGYEEYAITQRITAKGFVLSISSKEHAPKLWLRSTVLLQVQADRKQRN